MRNYWSLLPAIAVCVVVAVVYAVPTLIRPQLTANVFALFRSERPDPLTSQQILARRLGAIAALVAAVVLVGFNISLNREANGCYVAAKAWGADGSMEYDDPCTEMINGTSVFTKDTSFIESDPQPITHYQLVQGNKPKYLRWITYRPSYEAADILVGVPYKCQGELKAQVTKDKIVIGYDTTGECPGDSKIGLGYIELEEPIGDRKIVTVGDKPMEQINPDMDSWATVLKKLLTGG